MRYVLVACLLLPLGGCRDAVAPPDVDPLRTLLYYRQDTGENYLINSDGSAGQRLGIAGTGLLPLALSPDDDEIVFLSGHALLIGRVFLPATLDTLLVLGSADVSLASFSPDDQHVALFQYGAEPRLLVVRRAGGVDSIDLGGLSPVLPPVFSPDGDRIVLISQNDLSIHLTVVSIDGREVTTHPAGFSRFEYRLLFGWPRWTEHGLLIGTRRIGQTWDTLAVLALDGADPSLRPDVLFTAESPLLEYDNLSSYSLSADGRAIAVAAVPPVVGGRALYYATGGQRLQRILDDPDARPALPVILP